MTTSKDQLANRLKNIAAAYGHTSHTEDFVPCAKSSDLMILRDYHDPETNVHYADCECRCGRRVAALRYTDVIRGIIRSCGCKARLARAARAKVLSQRTKTRRFDHPLRKNWIGTLFGYIEIIDHITVKSYDDLPTGTYHRAQKFPENGFFWVGECACGERVYFTNRSIKKTSQQTCTSSVCKQLHDQKYPRSRVRWYIALNFAGKIPKSAYKRTRKAVSV